MKKLFPAIPVLALPFIGLLLAGCNSQTESSAPAAEASNAPAAVAAAPDTAALDVGIDIPYTKYVLDNGLTLLVHEDHKAPIVAVNVWYHVGSKNEVAGKTGFAHLFEHLMFNGSEHYNDDYFKPFQKVGATGMNGTTNEDRTNYFEVVPTTALDMALWMESDRMGYMVGAIDQARLDEQRGVVQNEKRQGENQPYGEVYNIITENVYPKGHPYSWSVIGSMDDLNAASLEDVRTWFNTYYGAANATLVVAGDVKPEEVKAKVEKYFGEIPAGPPLKRQATWIAKRNETHRLQMQDRVPQARVYMVWNVPEYGSAAGDYLEIAARILSDGKDSRLYKRLVYDEQIATDVDADVYLSEIGGIFLIDATAVPGGDLAKVEQAVREELAKFLRSGPSSEELARVKTQIRAEMVRGIERVGGFGGKSDILARNQVFLGNPDAWKISLQRQTDAGATDVREAAGAWLTDGDFVLSVYPYPEYATQDTQVDRGSVPAVTEFPSASFAQAEHATLSNGLDVYLIERHNIPVVNFDLVINAGYAADQDAAAGTAKLASEAMLAGAGTLDALAISRREAELGAELDTGVNVDYSWVNVSALKRNLEPTLALFADVALHPTFPQEDVEKLRKQQLAAIQREMVTPFSMALRVIPGLLYGADHAYGMPLTGSGTADSVQGITRDNLAQFHADWFKPGNATLFVVGDTTLAELQPLLEQRFGSWVQGETPAKNIVPVEQSAGSGVYILDRPGSIQSVVIAAKLVPARTQAPEFALQAAKNVLGGGFVARLNMNLREDKHWAYGAFGFIMDTQAQRPLVAYAPVQADKTAAAMAEIQQEFAGFVGANPVTAAELARVKDQSTLTLPGRWETANAVLNDLEEQVLNGLPADYWSNYAANIRNLDLAGVRAAAKANFQPDKLVWVVVGDRAKIEPEIRKLGLGDIKAIDANGQVLQ